MYNKHILSRLEDRTKGKFETLNRYFALTEREQNYGDFHPFEGVIVTTDSIEFKLLSHSIVLRVIYFTSKKSSLYRTYRKDIDLKTGETVYNLIPAMDMTFSLEREAVSFVETKKLWNEHKEQEFSVTDLRKFERDYILALAQYLEESEKAEWKRILEGRTHELTAH